jgi:glucans biosynthesis protein C
METSTVRHEELAKSAVCRDVGMDYLRSFVIVLVVMLHAMQAYVSFVSYNPDDYAHSMVPVADPNRFPLLDPFFFYIYSFMMPLLFLVSGLFVVSGLERRGFGGFLAARLQRLGPPFLAFAIVLGPLAFWPAYLASTTTSPTPYWIRCFTQDGWPVGPGWFLWVLFVFDVVVALVYRFAPRLLDHALHRPSALTFILAAIVVYAPFFPFIFPETWASLVGPFVFQPAKILLYFVYFLMGVGLGRWDGWRTRDWPRRPTLWLIGGTAAFVVYFACIAFFSGPNLWPVSPIVCGVAAAIASAAVSIALLGFFHRRVRSRRPIAGSLADNSFGIYVLHFPLVIWLEYLLTSATWSGGLKFLTVLAVALGVSWAASAALRRVPGVRRYV